MSSVMPPECDHQLLARLVRNDLPDDVLCAVERHMDQSPDCAMKVSGDAMISWDWETVRNGLGSDGCKAFVQEFWGGDSV